MAVGAPVSSVATLIPFSRVVVFVGGQLTRVSASLGAWVDLNCFAIYDIEKKSNMKINTIFSKDIAYIWGIIFKTGEPIYTNIKLLSKITTTQNNALAKPNEMFVQLKFKLT